MYLHRNNTLRLIGNNWIEKSIQAFNFIYANRGLNIEHTLSINQSYRLSQQTQ